MVTIFVDLTEQTYTFLMTLHFTRAFLLLPVLLTNFWFLGTMSLIYILVIFVNERTFLHITKLLYPHRKLENCLSTNALPILPLVIIQAFNQYHTTV